MSANQFLMQYQETDWNFIKKLTGMKHTVVVAECHTYGEKYYFELPKRNNTVVVSNLAETSV